MNNAYTFTTDIGELTFREDEYSATTALTTEAICGGDKIRVTTPLARHLRVLTDIFGYDEVKALIENMPAELRGGHAE